MLGNKGRDITAQVVKKAKAFGASLAGIADVEAIRGSPSHLIYGKLDEYRGIGAGLLGTVIPGEVAWPEGFRSAIVIAVEHPEEKPELDWWQDGLRGGTPGNETLISVNGKLSQWLREEWGFMTKKLPYHIEYGGVFLKDAAVIAGLGCIGKSNLLVTPEFGPRVRLRAMLTDELLLSTGPIDFDPCEECSMPCREACPQEAFKGVIYSEEEFGLRELPARTGVYGRRICNVQMELDVTNWKETQIEGRDEPRKVTRFCRICELACPVGKRAG